MRKVYKKFSGSSKLVGRVFQRQSCNVEFRDLQMTKDPSSLIKEVESLKEQVDSLKATLNNLQLDTEYKDIKLAQLAREKEKLSLNLAKMTRSNENLAQQLEDERNFYFREKETYCHEMNEYKKLKKVISTSNIDLPNNHSEETEKLKKTLEHTLQTNYNLSVKFLRMRETKNHLLRALIKNEDEHKKVINDLRTKIDSLTTELKEILNQKFNAPLSPSNKKYLQLVNQNSSLIYENLQLQMQIDQFSLRLRRDKIHRTKSETSQQKNKKIKSQNSDEKVIKIFERTANSSIPTVTILDEKDIGFKLHSSERKLQLPAVNESKLEVFQVSEVSSSSSIPNSARSRRRSRSAPKIVQSVIN